MHDLLTGAQHSALHLEMRDVYLPNDPEYLRWRAGHRPDPTDPDSWWDPWHQLVSDTAARDVAVRRARIVSEPLSDSIHHEYDWTFANITAGEQVRWLPRRSATDLTLPGNDFWLVDDRIALILHFTGDGDLADHELREDPALITRLHSSFDQVWQRATPHAKYWPG